MPHGGPGGFGGGPGGFGRGPAGPRPGGYFGFGPRIGCGCLTPLIILVLLLVIAALLFAR